MALQVKIDSGNEYIVDEDENGMVLSGLNKVFELKKISDSKFLALSELKSYTIMILGRDKDMLELNIDGYDLKVSHKDEIALMLDKLGMDVSVSSTVSEIVAPMPGLILEVQVKVGDQLSEGDGVLVLEAMKMENLIKSPIDATIAKVHVSQGQNVEKNQVLISF
ncbi:MAG: acetyl-CoA carboxylase biotin carboxyl carrier protein subunit [Cyclobacteriaceae bacterium]